MTTATSQLTKRQTKLLARSYAKIRSDDSPRVIRPLGKVETLRELAAMAMQDVLYGRNELRRKSDEFARQVRADAIWTQSAAVELATRSMIAGR